MVNSEWELVEGPKLLYIDNSGNDDDRPFKMGVHSHSIGCNREEKLWPSQRGRVILWRKFVGWTSNADALFYIGSSWYDCQSNNFQWIESSIRWTVLICIKRWDVNVIQLILIDVMLMYGLDFSLLPDSSAAFYVPLVVRRLAILHWKTWLPPNAAHPTLDLLHWPSHPSEYFNHIHFDWEDFSFISSYYNNLIEKRDIDVYINGRVGIA